MLAWLEKFLAFTMEQKAPAAIDLGGGDTTLGRLVASAPDLVQVMEDAGVSPVAFYLLGPRLSDLSPLASLERAGFRPAATALLMNQGRADATMQREDAFARTMAHIAFKDAVARGALPLWMPRLFPAKEVEDRHHLLPGSRCRGANGAPRHTARSVRQVQGEALVDPDGSRALHLSETSPVMTK